MAGEEAARPFFPFFSGKGKGIGAGIVVVVVLVVLFGLLRGGLSEEVEGVSFAGDERGNASEIRPFVSRKEKGRPRSLK